MLMNTNIRCLTVSGQLDSAASGMYYANLVFARLIGQWADQPSPIWIVSGPGF